jgi:predicted esterase YcpF (UPF0227 family)
MRKHVGNVLSISYNYIEPDEAYKEINIAIMQILQRETEIILVGTSLGGFWANFFAQKYKLKCVLINPSVHPWSSLKKYIGLNINFNSGKEKVLTSEHVKAYKTYESEILPGVLRYVVLAIEDKQLDYRVAEHLFKASSRIILINGGHRIQDVNLIVKLIIEASNREIDGYNKR